MIRTVITTIAPGVHEVRLHHGESRRVATGFNVTEHDNGRTLKVSLFSGLVPGAEWWRARAAAYFPAAETAIFDRLEAEGLRGRSFALKPRKPAQGS